MALDMQVVHFYDSLRVVSAVPVRDFFPPSFDIRGSSFSSATKVLMNGYEAPDFVVINDKKIVAQIPRQVYTDIVRDISVLSNFFTGTRASLVKFEVNANMRKSSGILYMMQMFVKILLTTRGTDIWNRSLGGSIRDYIGATINPSNTGSLVSGAMMAVANAETQLKRLQIKTPSLTSNERLSSAEVMNVVYNGEKSALEIMVRLNAVSGLRALALLSDTL